MNLLKQKKPSIAFFGSSLLSAYWNGAATYYRGIIKSLHQLGYKVTFYEPDAFERQKHKDLPNPDFAVSVVYSNNQHAVEKALQDAREHDILIKTSGVGVFDAYLERALTEIRKPGQQIVFWDVDAPATLDSVVNEPASEFKELIPEYDYILTYGGGQTVVDAYKSLNAKECIPVYNALDPETHFKVPVNPEFKCDLAFLGNRLPDREERVINFFVRVAEQLPAKNFVLGGSGWQDVKLPPNIKYVGHVYTTDHNAFNSSPKAVLNISRQSMADYGFSPATRVFEAAGAGACMITDYWKGIDLFFQPGKEILVAQNTNQVIDFVNSLDEKKAKAIGDAAYRRVLSEHTYEKRAKQLNNILSGRTEAKQIVRT